METFDSHLELKIPKTELLNFLPHLAPPAACLSSVNYSCFLPIAQAKNLGIILDSSFSLIPYVESYSKSCLLHLQIYLGSTHFSPPLFMLCLSKPTSSLKCLIIIESCFYPLCVKIMIELKTPWVIFKSLWKFKGSHNL